MMKPIKKQVNVRAMTKSLPALAPLLQAQCCKEANGSKALSIGSGVESRRGAKSHSVIRAIRGKQSSSKRNKANSKGRAANCRRRTIHTEACQQSKGGADHQKGRHQDRPQAGQDRLCGFTRQDLDQGPSPRRITRSLGCSRIGRRVLSRRSQWKCDLVNGKKGTQNG
jgi:hypothetical protein